VRLRVVIADDEATLRSLLRALMRTDHRFDLVGEAGDGREAMALIEELDPDVLLLDLGMPVMDGLEVLAALQGRERPRTIVLTGYSEEQTLRQAIELGAAACVVKGSGFDRLLDVIAGGEAA
jgi:DNA-binding NarL/FixJ family response regulator